MNDLNDNYQLEPDEQSYLVYRRSLRYRLDFYLNEIDPWLIPIHRLFVICIMLHVLFA